MSANFSCFKWEEQLTNSAVNKNAYEHEGWWDGDVWPAEMAGRSRMPTTGCVGSTLEAPGGLRGWV